MKTSIRQWREHLRDEHGLSSAAKLLGFVISTHAEHDSETATVWQIELAESVGRSTRQIIRATNELAQHGFIIREAKGHPSVPNTYRLTVPVSGIAS